MISKAYGNGESGLETDYHYLFLRIMYVNIINEYRCLYAYYIMYYNQTQLIELYILKLKYAFMKYSLK